jgi:LuxR family maltose regulon positive regulatory protein
MLLEPFGFDSHTAQPHANELLVDPLSARELEVLALVAAGYTNHEIAAQLHIGTSTVKKHINHIYDKLDVTHRAQAVARARSLQLLV